MTILNPTGSCVADEVTIFLHSDRTNISRYISLSIFYYILIHISYLTVIYLLIEQKNTEWAGHSSYPFGIYLVKKSIE